MSDTVVMEAAGAAPTLTLERHFKAPPEAVFRAWTQSEALRHWMGPTGFSAPEAEIDAREGGAYVLPMVSPDGKVYTARGVIRELAANRKLRFSWAWDQEDGSSGQPMEITLDFHPTETGTRLVLHQTNLIDDEARDKHAEGWTGSFDCLEAYLAG